VHLWVVPHNSNLLLPIHLLLSVVWEVSVALVGSVDSAVLVEWEVDSPTWHQAVDLMALEVSVVWIQT
jgi:hypothetical protein